MLGTNFFLSEAQQLASKQDEAAYGLADDDQPSMAAALRLRFWLLHVFQPGLLLLPFPLQRQLQRIEWEHS